MTRFANALVPGLGMCNITVVDGSISAIESATSPVVPDPEHAVVDLEGRLVVPGFVEPHAHLDKAYLSTRIDNDTGDLAGAIEAMERHRHTVTIDDIADRAERAARRMAAFGVTRIRTHVDTTLDGGLDPLMGLLEARSRCADVVDIEIAALMGWNLTGLGSRDVLALARDALAAGADVIGGCPHLDDDPTGAVDVLVNLALEHSVPLDLHADENLRVESDDLGALARRILRDGLSLRANASHCVSLSVKDPAVQRRIAEDVASAGVTVVVLPQTNLFLQSRQTTTSPPRGIAPVSILKAAGVTVGAGGDNLQDPFNPLGCGDPLENAALCVWAAHSSLNDALDLVSAEAAVCTGTTSVMSVGNRANFVALHATSVREALAERPADRVVVRAGVVV